MNVLALVTHSRPECLKLYLEQLLKNDELKDYLIYFFLDFNFHPDILKIIQWFRKNHRNIRVKMRSEQEAKKSQLPAFYNIFDAYRTAAKLTDEFVIAGEEDIIPTEDYLRYNRVAYKNFLSKYDRIFCLGTKRRPMNDLEGDPRLLIGDKQLCSPTCISKRVIEEIMNPLLEDDDFWTPPLFNQKVWSNLRNPPDHHIHHDGQLERMAEANGMFCLKPDQSRTGHIGVGGQHFKGTVAGNTLEERIEYMRSIMHSTEQLQAASENKRDMCGVPKTMEWDDLELDLDRDKVKTQKADFDTDNEFKEYILSCQER